MPALDALIGGGAIHISDQNKLKPVKTLCGLALDKESTKYFLGQENFGSSTCKVCRGIYFDEKWTTTADDEPKDEPKDETPTIQEEQPPVRSTLFGGLSKPVNTHSDPLDRNEVTVGESQDGA